MLVELAKRCADVYLPETFYEGCTIDATEADDPPPKKTANEVGQRLANDLLERWDFSNKTRDEDTEDEGMGDNI
jgi:hypothetical protein